MTIQQYDSEDHSSPKIPPLKPGNLLVYVMAVACGMAVANLYYAQPLLHTLAQRFGTSEGTTGLIVTMTQLGYVIGLALIVPLGDLLERRQLITVVSAGTAIALAGAAISPGIGSFLFACLAIGLTAVVAQVLVPFAAALAADEQRGAVIGRVMAGLLLGILLARTVSGFIADACGWRAVFWLATVIMIVQSAVLWRMLPQSRGGTRLSYPALIGSVFLLFREEPLLRRRIVYGTCGFAAFSVFWTSIAFLLARPPYGYSDSIIGLFGLVGAAGALSASFAGQIHDRGDTRPATGILLALVVIAFVIMGVYSTHLSAIIVGVVLLDIGQQGSHILNQSVIYTLNNEARSRLTTAYMTCFFFGGVIGSASSGYVFEFGGWSGVSWLGGMFGGIAFLYWLTELRNCRV
ncbi:MFS transporter [Desulforhopalus vacuolatus]|uniref:MFS transporter n=1 Tax=Desulforhopalus vacuolatus TaxID=40414 RepID=UPI001962D54B|nr:MFS transporter [Desulforhopalus vacuolatus]MBM9518461.1 MFS transporter [Desulforhopalus vacuolatus]